MEQLPGPSNSSESLSISSLDSLNTDCLEAIFKPMNLSLPDLLKLRHVSQSWNKAICRYIAAFTWKLQLFLDAGQFTEADPGNLTLSMRSDQSHFRLANFHHIPSLENDDKIAYLGAFVYAHMPNLTHLALLINHETHFRSVARLLRVTPKLRVLSIDLTSFRSGNLRKLWVSELVDLIAELPEIESLYFFSSESSEEIIRSSFGRTKLEALTSGRKFIEVMLPKLKILHSSALSFPDCGTFDKVEEIRISHEQVETFAKNNFPSLRKFIIPGSFLEHYSKQPRIVLNNVRILKVYDSFTLTDAIFDALNAFPNLFDLHCHLMKTSVIPQKRNTRIKRLYIKYHPQYQPGQQPQPGQARVNAQPPPRPPAQQPQQFGHPVMVPAQMVPGGALGYVVHPQYQGPQIGVFQHPPGQYNVGYFGPQAYGQAYAQPLPVYRPQAQQQQFQQQAQQRVQQFAQQQAQQQARMAQQVQQAQQQFAQQQAQQQARMAQQVQQAQQQFLQQVQQIPQQLAQQHLQQFAQQPQRPAQQFAQQPQHAQRPAQQQQPIQQQIHQALQRPFQQLAQAFQNLAAPMANLANQMAPMANPNPVNNAGRPVGGVTEQQMNGYVAFCEKHFRALKMFKCEYPQRKVNFEL